MNKKVEMRKEDKLIEIQRVYDTVVGWARHADSKARHLVALEALKFSALVFVMASLDVSTFNKYFYYVVLGLGGVVSAISCYAVFRLNGAIKPRRKADTDTDSHSKDKPVNLIYYETINKFNSYDEYADAFNEVSLDGLIDDYVRNVRTISNVCTEKMADIEDASELMHATFYCYIFIIILAFIGQACSSA
jgi:hypothetical protein